MDDLSWMDDISPAIELQPNTLYYFNPPYPISDLPTFANRITNSDYMKKWLLRIYSTDREYAKGGINYFATNEDLTITNGWCNVTSVEEAKSMYFDCEHIDARKEFNI